MKTITKKVANIYSNVQNKVIIHPKKEYTTTNTSIETPQTHKYLNVQINSFGKDLSQNVINLTL